MTEIITSGQIRGEIKHIQPGCYTLLTDPEFLSPPAKEFKERANWVVERMKQSIQHQGAIERLWMCEDISKVTMGQIVLSRVVEASQNKLPIDEMFSWSFGLCFGTRFNAWAGEHYNLMVRTEGGIFYIYDPRTQEFWSLSTKDDTVLFYFS